MSEAPAQTCTLIDSINSALTDAMEADRKVVVLGEDVADPEGGGVVGISRGLSTRFGPLRCRSTPISEQAIIGAAIGASLVGYRPVAEIMLMNFTTVCMDMIHNHAAKLRFMSGGQTSVPIVIRTMTGAGFGGGGQHTDYLEAWFAHSPGLKVVAPSTPQDAYSLMRACIEDDDPCIFIENLPLLRTKGARHDPSLTVAIGKAAITRPGQDLTIIAHSRMVAHASMAADKLADQGVNAEVVDLRTISPWDRETVLASVAKTRRALIVHEAVRAFGIGGEIASTISEELFGDLLAPVARLGAPFCPTPFAKTLEDAFVVSPAQIEAAALAIVNSQRNSA